MAKMLDMKEVMETLVSLEGTPELNSWEEKFVGDMIRRWKNANEQTEWMTDNQIDKATEIARKYIK